MPVSFEHGTEHGSWGIPSAADRLSPSKGVPCSNKLAQQQTIQHLGSNIHVISFQNEQNTLKCTWTLKVNSRQNFTPRWNKRDLRKTKEREISCLSAEESQRIPSMHYGFPLTFSSTESEIFSLDTIVHLSEYVNIGRPVVKES